MIKNIVYSSEMMLFQLYDGREFVSHIDWMWLIKDFGWKQADYIMVGDEFDD